MSLLPFALRNPLCDSGIIETRKITRKEAHWQFPISGSVVSIE